MRATLESSDAGKGADSTSRRSSAVVCSVGVALVVFAVAAVVAPAGVDIIDGEIRYEVARSLAEHGDFVVRNDDLWFNVFPGRNGDRYSYYRVPHSVLGAGAIWIADGTGGRSEPRRQFFFVLVSAVAGGVLSAAYFIWFCRDGMGKSSALVWAFAGVLCTPVWYYSTTTFDDILGTAVVVWALVLAVMWADVSNSWRGVISGLLFGLAFNCKEPLIVFVLVAVGTVRTASSRVGAWYRRFDSLAIGVAIGVIAYYALEAWKFPGDTKAQHGSLLTWYMPPWPGNTEIALLVLAASPSAGVLWYSPTLPLCVTGLVRCLRDRTRFAVSVGLALLILVAFIASISFFKGDPAWGPRYLTPAFAVLWLFSARGSAKWSRAAVSTLLVSGFAVQLLALAVDPQRLYIERKLPNMFGALEPLLYFDAANAHLVQRPREIREVWHARDESGERFSPGEPTVSFPFIPLSDAGPDAIQRYKMLNVFRPWWASYGYLPPEYRPVSRPAALVTLGAIALVGIVLLHWGGALGKSGEARRA